MNNHAHYKRMNILLIIIGILVLVNFFISNVSAQSLKCFILAPPEQLLDGVKRIAITDFTVTSSYHADDPPS